MSKMTMKANFSSMMNSSGFYYLATLMKNDGYYDCYYCYFEEECFAVVVFAIFWPDTISKNPCLTNRKINKTRLEILGTFAFRFLYKTLSACLEKIFF